jgi:hypothetical protein
MPHHGSMDPGNTRSRSSMGRVQSGSVADGQAWVPRGGRCYVGDGGNVEFVGGHLTIAHTGHHNVADHDVIGQLALTVIDPGGALGR